MLSKLYALWDLFKKGSSVDDPAKWKNRQITVTVLTPVIMSVAYVTNTFGLDLQLDQETAAAIAGGIIAIVNVVLTITTTDKIGLSNKTDDTKDNKDPCGSPDGC